MKALALFSGGLDSTLAVKLVTNQGIEVIALNFVSHFFGGKNPKADAMAKQLGVQLEYIDFKDIHKEIVKNPPSGYGKNMNPCIDCHALMLKTASELLDKYGANFIITGEVLGQRPMSQNRSALNRVENLSGMAGYVVRPLCAKAIDETIPEKNGWIDRNKLMDIQGRGRKRQLELADELGIVEYEMPGGGCLLTEPNYGRRIRILKDDEQFDNDFLFYLCKIGRFFRLDKGKYIFVGRKEEENLKIEEYKDEASLYILDNGIPGPVILGFGEFSDDEKLFAESLFSRYSKVKGKTPISMKCNGEIVEIEALDLVKIEEMMKEYLVI
ncbi:7-cyano-7-deazaguanine synthase [Haliovirga abyssi]|uniref:tRNA 2-thiouridine(34) synthase MnmA n=1 Tax=Haliovirga abyssi TaxID=2996794 RepID=A0AAU9DJ17_9FUSO|nr:7-cyano-7-deazaguanine synthase [Haliovirga abyssi]BDU51622.1 tRNA 2-thiouridine(34) synthase MnmA [Haliovirga abyssi]